MTPKKKKPVAHGWARHQDYVGMLPLKLTYRQCILLSDSGRFPKYTRKGGWRSPALWKRSEIVAWIEKSFGALLPSRVAEIKRAETAENRVVFEAKSTLVATPTPSPKKKRQKRTKAQ